MNVILLLITIVSVIAWVCTYTSLMNLGNLYDKQTASLKEVLDHWKNSIDISNETLDLVEAQKQIINKQREYIQQLINQSTDDGDWWKKE